MKRAIVNFAQFVRYLADRASIKLTQFAMRNVSANRRFQVWNYFYVCRLGEEEEENRSSPFRLPLWLNVRLFVSLLAVTLGVEKREFKNLTARNIQSTEKELNQRMPAKICTDRPLCHGDLNNLYVFNNIIFLIFFFPWRSIITVVTQFRHVTFCVH